MPVQLCGSSILRPCNCESEVQTHSALADYFALYLSLVTEAFRTSRVRQSSLQTPAHSTRHFQASNSACNFLPVPSLLPSQCANTRRMRQKQMLPARPPPPGKKPRFRLLSKRKISPQSCDKKYPQFGDLFLELVLEKRFA